MLYADTSAIVRAYMGDELGSADLKRLVLLSREPVLVSEIARVEVASAFAQARRGGRQVDDQGLLRRFDQDCAAGGPITLMTLRPAAILPSARRIVLEHSVGALDAVHLAVALEEGPLLSGGEPPDFLTLDRRQAAAAKGLGLNVRES